MNKEVKKVDSDSDVTEAQNVAMEMFIETILPKVTPFIKPATKKFSDFMNEGYTVIIYPIDGVVHIFQIKSEDVACFELEKGKEPIASFDVQEFIEKMLKGGFGKK